MLVISIIISALLLSLIKNVGIPRFGTVQHLLALHIPMTSEAFLLEIQFLRLEIYKSPTSVCPSGRSPAPCEAKYRCLHRRMMTWLVPCLPHVSPILSLLDLFILKVRLWRSAVTHTHRQTAVLKSRSRGLCD